ALGEDEATNHWSPEWDPNKLALMGHAPRTFVLCLALSGQLRHSLEAQPNKKKSSTGRKTTAAQKGCAVGHQEAIKNLRLRLGDPGSGGTPYAILKASVI
ncbi:MAG: hypothetical protein P4L55_24015, partial [Syntrophobacteraceae bacterium]|nr:hypothetical protein [Syntrophobacteraceae bacterium]